MNDLLDYIGICPVFRQGKLCVCYRKFFDTFGESIKKCIHSVLLQGIVVQIRMGSGGGLD